MLHLDQLQITAPCSNVNVCSSPPLKQNHLYPRSFYANVALFVIKMVVAIRSMSLSIIVSALDSLLDLISGFILYVTDRASTQQDKYKFPIGKARMQPLGILVFSSCMG